jgi:hypothetical protein
MAKNERSVLEIYKGVSIRASNVIRFRVGALKYKSIIDEVERTGLSMPKVISLSGKPCNKCKGVSVICYNDNGEQVEVKRGVLSDYTMINNGTNILNQKKKPTD